MFILEILAASLHDLIIRSIHYCFEIQILSLTYQIINIRGGYLKENDLKFILNKLKNASRYKDCLWNDENCNGKVKKCHSIQNNRILNKLAENGKVMYFDTESIVENGGKFILKETGRKIATTFTGFCDYHDTEIFKPIELKDYEYGNKEQEYIFAYRALAKEFHAKLSEKNSAITVIKELENPILLKDILPSQVLNDSSKIEYLKSISKYYLEGITMAVNDLNIIHNRMKDDIINKNFETLTTKYTVLPGISVAASATLSIEYDLKGKPLNNIYDFEKPMKPLFFNVFPQGDNTIVLFSYFNEDHIIYEKFVLSILEKPLKNQQIIISNIIITYLENFVISPKMWASFSEKKKKKILKLFNDTIFNRNQSLVSYRFNLFDRK
jgi:hypothetical protein